MDRSLDFDEQQLRALTYEVARAASAQRSAVLENMIVGLDNISAGTPSAGIIPSADAGQRVPSASLADVAQVSTDLMIKQACYRSAAAAIANPVAASLREFLA